MDLVTLALLLVALYVLYAWCKKHYSYFEELGVPYVSAVPLFGNTALSTLRWKHITETVRDIYNHNKEAKYVGIFDFVRPVFFIRDPELIKSITIKNFDNFPDHLNFVDEDLDPLFSSNLFLMHGERWREARNLLSPAFTSSKMKIMFDLMTQCADNVVTHLRANTGSEIFTKDLFARYANDVIANCAFGISINSLKDQNNRFYVLGRRATNFEGLPSVKFFLSRAFPKLVKMLRVRFFGKEISDFFEEVIGETVRTRDEKGINRPDMIQLMMDARGKTSENLKLDIHEMTAQAFVFFFAGFDSTASQMCVISHELILNPDVQRRLQEEIDGVLLQTSNKPTYEAVNAMPYLDAVFHEAIRLHPQAFALDRVCKKAFELPPSLPGGKPFTLQPGMSVWIPVAAIHHDEHIFENPKKFNPDRYVDKKVTMSQVENMGFGIGPRGCIGYRFAILETKILFFHLLANFTLIASEKTRKNFEYATNSFTIVPKGGYWMSVVPRNK